MDEVGKQRVKDALIGQAEAELRSSRTDVTRHDSAAKLDQDSSFSVDDQSQSDEAGDLGGLFEGVADRQAGVLKQIRDLDFGLSSAVSPGALVGFDGDRYVVGVVAAPFDCDGITYEGLSTDAPIYPALAGLRLGDTFSFGGHDHRIDFLA
jgi:hypothetical protein